MNFKITLVVLCALAGAAIYTVFLKPTPEQPAETVEQPSPKPQPQPIVRDPELENNLESEPAVAANEPLPDDIEPLIDPPTQLDNSDTVVLQVINDIAPKLSTWLLPEQQVRKWVLAIDLLANGELPKKYPPLNFPMAPFKIEQNDKKMTTGNSNFSRAKPLITAITAVDPKLAARYYQHWLPTLEMAYREQGKPGSFDARLREAIDNVLSVEPLSQPATLHQPHVFYQYKDPELEQRTDLNKLMWRMGPENTALVQDYLKQLKKHL